MIGCDALAGTPPAEPGSRQISARRSIRRSAARCSFLRKAYFRSPISSNDGQDKTVMKISRFQLTALILSGLFFAISERSHAQSSNIAASQADPDLGKTIVLSPINVSASPVGCFG